MGLWFIIIYAILADTLKCAYRRLVHLNWGGQARGNSWSGMVSNTCCRHNALVMKGGVFFHPIQLLDFQIQTAGGLNPQGEKCLRESKFKQFLRVYCTNKLTPVQTSVSQLSHRFVPGDDWA